MEEEKIRREASVLRYTEKRQSRLFSKKIIYQVRKLNADKRPRLKVENNIVGAPCGVMDQMTSACGEANQLLAMVCQVYNGYVRVGAFMGLKIIKSTANGMKPNELEDNCVEMLEVEASLDYLCNVEPHRQCHSSRAIRMEDNFFYVIHDLVLLCHCSYSACGLGSYGTDRLVQLVQFVSRFLSLTAALTPTVPTTRHFSHTHNSSRRSSPLASLSTVAGPSPPSPVHTPSFNSYCMEFLGRCFEGENRDTGDECKCRDFGAYRYEALYAKMIPKSMTGDKFLEKYTDHNDLVTVVDNKRSYGVENNIVGAPCGVMDQMTSACGEANQLLAMVCQVYYGSVRVGAFMGLKIIKSTANGMNPDELEDNCVEMLEVEASLDYLCIVAPHSYSACGLGLDGTYRLVQLVQEMQHRKISKSGDGSLYGAKNTGGGTVCVIGKNCLRSTEQILQVICWFV
ncbi:hypothetical protein LguiA_004693 [Lonicera macranthoides]